MLQVDLRALARGEAALTRGELPRDDPALEGVDVPLREPVFVDGRLQSIGEGRFYWQGTVRTVVQGECRRCLTTVATPLSLELGALFTQDPEALDDPDAYPVAPEAAEIDVRPAIREELLLAAPRYVVCREDCKGLCPHCGQDLNVNQCACTPAPLITRGR